MEKKMIDQEALMMIHSILHELDEPYKEVFTLRVFGELSFSQIAKVFDKSENWACVTYHRAKKKIQNRMEVYYHE
jgi:RNA polymerase sigma-70 factor (ECF subfamily)